MPRLCRARLPRRAIRALECGSLAPAIFFAFIHLDAARATVRAWTSTCFRASRGKTTATRPQRLCSYLLCVLYSLVKCVGAARGLIPHALLAGVQQAGSTVVRPKKSRAPEPCDSSAPLDCAGKFLRLSGSICHHSIPARIPRQEVSSQSSVHFCACLCKTIQQPSKSHPPLARGCIVAQPSAPSYA